MITAHGHHDEELTAFNYQNIVCLHLHLTNVPKCIKVGWSKHDIEQVVAKGANSFAQRPT
jgi:hypothetical protein